MGVEIKSGASTDLLTIDPTSKAARVTLYDAAGTAINKASIFDGAVAVSVRQSAATAATAVVWGLHNPSATVNLYVQKIDLRCFFDGTAAATLMKYEIIKATSVSAFSAGSTVTAVKKRTSLTTIAVPRVLDTGLTTTGIANIQVLGNLVMGRVTQTATNYQQANLLFDFTSVVSAPIQLVQNEILAIRQTVTSVVGDNIVGSVEWIEV
jgi:hypothetical protein